MTKVKVIGTQYGIKITKPWSNEMYAHNDKVRAEMERVITDLFKGGNRATKQKVASLLAGVNYGYEPALEELWDDFDREIANVQNFWLYDWVWPRLLKMGLVTELPQQMVGYDINNLDTLVV